MTAAYDAVGDQVLVTGGAGFIGSHTVDHLVAEGCRVIVLDNLSSGKRENLAQWDDNPRAELVVANVADGLFVPLAEVTRRHGPIARLASELFLRYYSAGHGVPATALRLFNVYGPRQDPSSPYSGVISIFTDRSTAGRALTIHGDGQQTRDFVYVGDVSRAVVDACLSDRGDGAVVNIGTGRETTIDALARLIIELCGSSSGVEYQPARPGDILRSVAATGEAEQLLGFRANVALRDGLRETLASVRGASRG